MRRLIAPPPTIKRPISRNSDRFTISKRARKMVGHFWKEKVFRAQNRYEQWISNLWSSGINVPVTGKLPKLMHK